MNREKQTKSILESISYTSDLISKRWLIILLGIGALGIILGLFSSNPEVVLHALLINTVFFTSITLGGLTFSNIFTLTDAFWGRSIKRIAESFVSFLPIGTLLFFLLLFFGSFFFEWYDHDKVIYSKAWWLNIPSFVFRNILLFFVVLLLTYFYLKNSLRPDFILAKKLGKFFINPFSHHFTKNAEDCEKEIKIAYKKNRKLSTFLVISITLLTSLIAFDWMMSIDQEWFSTMFGVQYYVSCMIAAGAFLMILIGFLREKFALEEYISINRYHDLAKLTFAFTVGWTYMIFSQVLVIWYANLPEETPYLVLRMKSEEWGWLFWVLFVMTFVVTFFGLMSRTACRSIPFSRIIAIILFCGVWLEKYFLIIPSIQENTLGSKTTEVIEKIPGPELLPFLIIVLISIGFLGLFLLCISYFIKKIPLIPISDYRFFRDSHH